MSALGLIETKGLVAAIESADAMLKAADVHLLEKSLVGSGLVTITVTGEVSAVKASVEAASAAVRQLNGGKLVSEHVIPRPDTELENVILTRVPSEEEAAPAAMPGPDAEPEEKAADEAQLEKNDSFEKADDAESSSEDVLTESESSEPEKEAADSMPAPEMPVADEVEEVVQPAPEPEAAPVKKAAPKAPSKAESARYDISQLKKMNVSKLRNLARQMEKISLNRKEIKFARKKELIEEIMNAYRQEEE